MLCETAPARQLLPLRASFFRISLLVPSNSQGTANEKQLELTRALLSKLKGEFILVVDAPLSACPRRPADGSFALVNTGSNPRIYKLNVSEQGKDLVAPSTLPGAPAAGAAGKYGNGVLVNREGGFEFQSECGAKYPLFHSVCLSSWTLVPRVRELDAAEAHRLTISSLHTGRLFCPRCQLQVAYETRPGEGQKGDVTFILPGQSLFLSSFQSLRQHYILCCDPKLTRCLCPGPSGALSDVQNKVPSEAFGEPAVTPAGPVATEPSPTVAAATAA